MEYELFQKLIISNMREVDPYEEDRIKAYGIRNYGFKIHGT